MSAQTHDNWWTRNRASRRALLRGGGAAGLGLAGAALIGCGDDDDSGASPTATSPAGSTSTPSGGSTGTSTPAASNEGPRQGGHVGLRAASIPQDNFDIAVNWGEAIGLSGIHVYDRILSLPLDGTNTYVLEAGESIEVQDELTVVAKLKEGLVYQDKAPVNGRPVRTEDIAQWYEYVKNAEGVLWGTFHQDVLDYTETPDDRTLVIHLKQPTAYLFSMVQLGNPGEQAIIPPELFDNIGQNEPVGSGPYQMKEYQFGVSYTYERNPTYWGASENLPYIDERTVLVLPDASAQEAAFRSEQINTLLAQTSETADRMINDLGDQLIVEEMVGLNTRCWNCSSQRDTWDDMRVREGLYRAIQPDVYVDLVEGGWAELCTGITPAGLTNFQLDESISSQYKFQDPEAGRQLLEAAGFDFNGEYLISSQISPINEVMVQVFANQLSEIGVRTRIELMPVPEWLEDMAGTGNYDFFAGGHPSYETPQIPLRLHHANTRQVNKATNIADPEIDAMIEESERTVDPDAHREQVMRIQEELLKRYAHLYQVMSPINRALTWSYVHDWRYNPSTSLPEYNKAAWVDV